MVLANYPCLEFDQQEVRALLGEICCQYHIWGPTLGPDQACRLGPLAEFSQKKAGLPFLPLKKLLLPPREEVWRYEDGRYAEPEDPDWLAVVGVPLCELQAVWYLDQVFADDEPYLSRRQRLLIIGQGCEPTGQCRCRSEQMPVSGDLFLEGGRLWILSSAGQDLLVSSTLKTRQADAMPLPWPTIPNVTHVYLTPRLFTDVQHSSLWSQEARRCLSCGACSVVCPTCYCFDMLDVVDSRGEVSRKRAWDNCFFAEHGQVAGGFNFRPDRASRLHFRVEHKRLGFGALSGQGSCVGCGRCRMVCPVNIDLDEIVELCQREVLQ